MAVWSLIALVERRWLTAAGLTILAGTVRSSALAKQMQNSFDWGHSTLLILKHAIIDGPTAPVALTLLVRARVWLVIPLVAILAAASTWFRSLSHDRRMGALIRTRPRRHHSGHRRGTLGRLPRAIQ